MYSLTYTPPGADPVVLGTGTDPLSADYGFSSPLMAGLMTARILKSAPLNVGLVEAKRFGRRLAYEACQGGGVCDLTHEPSGYVFSIDPHPADTEKSPS